MNINQDLDYNVKQAKREDVYIGACDEGAPISGTLINNGKTPVKTRKFTYLVTVKCHAKVHVPKLDLDEVLALTIKKVNASKLKADWSSIIGYEEDSIGRMHIHTFLVTEKELYMKKYQRPGWSIHFSDRKDGKVMTSAIALKYITKLDQSPNAVEQRFDANYYRFVGRFLPALLDIPDQAGCKSAEGFCRVLRSDTRLPTYSDILGKNYIKT